MTEGEKPSFLESVAGLMIMAGSMTVISAVPGGALLVFLDYGRNRDRWAFALGGSLAGTGLLIGVILVSAGLAIANRHWKRRYKAPPA